MPEQLTVHGEPYGATQPRPTGDMEVNRYIITKYGARHWGVWDGTTLVAVCVYRKGAREICRRLEVER